MDKPTKSIHEVKAKVNGLVQFVAGDIWRARMQEMPFLKRLWMRSLRILLLALRGFREDACMLRASSLTFYTLLSIVPVVALAFGIAKGFGFHDMLERQLYQNFPGQEEVVTRVVVFADSLLETARGGVIAGFGLVVLFYAVFKVLGNIEHSFNQIWQVKRERTLARKLGDYLAIMLLSPILVILQSSATVFVTTQIANITQKIALLGYFSPLIYHSYKLIPYFLVWVLFTLIYLVMPNTRVKFQSALVAGIIAGSGYQILQGFYFTFQIGFARYNAIYGSFAALPLLLVWLQASWLIVLLGAEIAYASQNVGKYEFEQDTTHASPGLRKLVALRVCLYIVRRFSQGTTPVASDQMADDLGLPLPLTNRVLRELTDSDILREVQLVDSDQQGFMPARDAEHLSISFILEALETRGVNGFPLPESPEFVALSDALEDVRASVEKSPGNKLLKEI
ncbi:MAG: YhjD/YihY/BrkB family envelope integrity protein [Desulfobacterales bacterium]|nr:YhjD/YihY/BrkB family envelope integrity protein [Desulfobacterales bacterium]